MAFAPHTNDRRTVGVDPIVAGQFREAEHGHTFEFALRMGADLPHAFAPEFPHLVYVGPLGQTRYAKVLKTVAHVVVDEGPGGEPITEKWSIRGHKTYASAEEALADERRLT